MEKLFANGKIDVASFSKALRISVRVCSCVGGRTVLLEKLKKWVAFGMVMSMALAPKCCLLLVLSLVSSLVSLFGKRCLCDSHIHSGGDACDQRRASGL